MSNNKDKNRAIIGTILVHATILAALFFLYLSTPLPLPGEEGVEVQIGSSEEGQISIAAAQPAPVIPQKIEETQPEEIIEDEVVTSNDDDAPAIAPEKEKKKEEKKTEEKIEIEVKEEPVVKPKKTEPEPEPEPVVNSAAIYGGSKNKTGNNSESGKGITDKSGDQGKANGTPDAKGFSGTGANGDGISFQLGGRGKVSLPIPKYTTGEQGRVVVEILVDRKGNVVRATAGKKIPNSNIGTTTTDQKLWRLSVEAAKKSRFTPKDDAAEKQKGFIIYNYIRLN